MTSQGCATLLLCCDLAEERFVFLAFEVFSKLFKYFYAYNENSC